MQDFNNSEEGIQHCACKIKAKKEKIQHMFQLDIYTSVDKH